MFSLSVSVSLCVSVAHALQSDRQCGRVQNGTVMSDATCVGGESLDGPLQTDGFENPVDKLSMEHDTIIGGSSTTNRAEDASHPAGIFTTTSPMSSPLGGKGDMSDLGMKTPTLEDFGLSKYYSTQVATPPPKFGAISLFVPACYRSIMALCGKGLKGV